MNRISSFYSWIRHESEINCHKTSRRISKNLVWKICRANSKNGEYSLFTVIPGFPPPPIWRNLWAYSPNYSLFIARNGNWIVNIMLVTALRLKLYISVCLFVFFFLWKKNPCYFQRAIVYNRDCYSQALKSHALCTWLCLFFLIAFIYVLGNCCLFLYYFLIEFDVFISSTLVFL